MGTALFHSASEKPKSPHFQVSISGGLTQRSQRLTTKINQQWLRNSLCPLWPSCEAVIDALPNSCTPHPQGRPQNRRNLTASQRAGASERAGLKKCVHESSPLPRALRSTKASRSSALRLRLPAAYSVSPRINIDARRAGDLTSVDRMSTEAR